jgi:hypothetical protein
MLNIEVEATSELIVRMNIEVKDTSKIIVRNKLESSKQLAVGSHLSLVLFSFSYIGEQPFMAGALPMRMAS